MSSIKLITAALSALFLTVVAVVLRSGELYFMSVALLLVPITSYAFGRMAIKSLTCTREAPEYVLEGEPIQIKLHMRGKSNLLGPIQAADTLPEWIEEVEQGQDAREIRSNDGSSISYTVVARKRGEYIIGPLNLRVSDPLGFFRFSYSPLLASRLVVLPKALHLPGLYARLTGSIGEHQFEASGTKGDGTDFHGVREYQLGDELRRVHWRSTAKYGRLNVIEFEYSRAMDTIIAVDLKEGSEVGSGLCTSLEYAVRIAASVAEQAITLASPVKLACAGVEGRASVFGRGAQHLYVLLESLARVHADRKESLPQVLLAEVERAARNSMVICIASSVDADLPRCVQLLTSRGTRVQLVLVTLSTKPSEETEKQAWQCVHAGASLLVIQCSPENVAWSISYDHAA